MVLRVVLFFNAYLLGLIHFVFLFLFFLGLLNQIFTSSYECLGYRSVFSHIEITQVYKILEIFRSASQFPRVQINTDILFT